MERSRLSPGSATYPEKKFFSSFVLEHIYNAQTKSTQHKSMVVLEMAARHSIT